MRKCLAGLLACCAVFSAAQERNASKAVGHTNQNQTFAQEESQAAPVLAETEGELRQKINQSPNAADLVYKLALVLRLEHKSKESLATYTRAASLRKPDAMQLRSVALDYVQLNDFDDAIRWLRVAIGMEPSNIDVLYSLGRCLYTQNNFSQAEAAFRRVLQLSPNHVKAEENLGLTYDGENKPQLAEKALRIAVQWADQGDIQDAWPYLDLGAFLLDQARTAEALPFLQKAVTLAPNSAPAHEKLGRALVGTGKPQDAVIQLESAAKLDPNNPKIHFELGRAYRESGALEKARTEFQLSKSLYGNHNQD